MSKLVLGKSLQYGFHLFHQLWGKFEKPCSLISPTLILRDNFLFFWCRFCRFPNVAKSILERREDLCMNGLRNTIETYGLPVLRPQPFQNMLKSSDIIRYRWDEVKFIDRDPHWYTRRVKEAFHIRLHSNNINRDSGIEIPEGWIATIKQHNSQSVPQRTREGTASCQNNEHRNPPIINNYSEDRNAPVTNSHGAAYNETRAQPIDIIAWWRPAVSGRNVTIHTYVTISWDKRLISYHLETYIRTTTIQMLLFQVIKIIDCNEKSNKEKTTREFDSSRYFGQSSCPSGFGGFNEATHSSCNMYGMWDVYSKIGHR